MLGQVWVVFLLVALSAFAADARGFVQLQRCDSFTGSRLQFQKIDGKKLTKQIALNIPQPGYWDFMLKDSFKTSSTECSGSSTCEMGVRGTIRILHVSRRLSFRRLYRMISGIAGEFALELQDGRKIDGSFRAKVRKPTTEIICE